MSPLAKFDISGSDAERFTNYLITRDARKMVGLQIDWKGIAKLYMDQGLPPVVVPTPIWYPLNVMKDGERIGRATSIAWSPTLESVIAFGHLDIECCEPGTDVEVEFFEGEKSALVTGQVVKLPFIDLKRAK